MNQTVCNKHISKLYHRLHPGPVTRSSQCSWNTVIYINFNAIFDHADSFVNVEYMINFNRLVFHFLNVS
ncbi:hypothetical protein D4764_07G0009840 [Takifugu flavidus]|uniref:Uncharacterized protein n=1 Tax=Takifugu flavidus TaxID=433684 RepID=A0A5C6MTT3_9TELE|nr:hypothetical protein D4764_07G0009840 [Takifugu flavidus]